MCYKYKERNARLEVIKEYSIKSIMFPTDLVLVIAVVYLSIPFLKFFVLSEKEDCPNVFAKIGAERC